MLKVRNLSVKYGVIQAVKNISFKVKKGQIVALVGSNGAGKSSTLKAIMNLTRNSGEIVYNASDISGFKTHKIVQNGLTLVPEGREVFINLSVDENLNMGGFYNKNTTIQKQNIYSIFPRLSQKKSQLAGTLSGGEQQMLAIGRALMSEPKMIILDEPSLGLAPMIVSELFDVIKKLKKSGITVLLVEQNAYGSLKIADYAYVIENGEIVLENEAQQLLQNNEIIKKYLGG